VTEPRGPGSDTGAGAVPRGPSSGVDPRAIRWDRAGLVPSIVQDVRDGRVLMLGYLDDEALAATLATGEVHFHSRSRGRLWRKGETSGNVLPLAGVALDCDGDALLMSVEPAGPTCHRGTRSCFDPDGAPQGRTAQGRTAQGHTAQGFAWLEFLWATIDERGRTRPAGSYTARLLAGGVNSVGRKVTEEATEVLLAAKDDAAAEGAIVAGATGADGAALAADGALVADASLAADEAAAAETVTDAAAAGAARIATTADPGLARDRTRARLAEETADLLYHALVLLRERGLEPGDVLRVLEQRHTGAQAEG
jgi:phosphoribosyl-AMP cyclohydrolase / phosphoribosyl-ATP pyrophosphohydrolase